MLIGPLDSAPFLGIRMDLPTCLSCSWRSQSHYTKSPGSLCVPERLLCWDSTQPWVSDPRPWWSGLTSGSPDPKVAVWLPRVAHSLTASLGWEVGVPLVPCHCHSWEGHHPAQLFFILCGLSYFPDQSQCKYLNIPVEGAIFTWLFHSSPWLEHTVAASNLPSWSPPYLCFLSYIWLSMYCLKDLLHYISEVLLHFLSFAMGDSMAYIHEAQKTTCEIFVKSNRNQQYKCIEYSELFLLSFSRELALCIEYDKI